jgi:hypothetical protein
MAKAPQSRHPVLVTACPTRYLAIDGHGPPGTPVFRRKLGTLYGVAYGVRLARARARRAPFSLGRLEALWWIDGLDSGEITSFDADRWRWKLLLPVPEDVDSTEVCDALDELRRRARDCVTEGVSLFELDEGEAVEALHLGPYQEEHETIERMRAFAAARGRRFTGAHHEIYLSDPRHTRPARLKTILRHSVAPVG